VSGRSAPPHRYPRARQRRPERHDCVRRSARRAPAAGAISASPKRWPASPSSWRSSSWGRTSTVGCRARWV